MSLIESCHLCADAIRHAVDLALKQGREEGREEGRERAEAAEAKLAEATTEMLRERREKEQYQHAAGRLSAELAAARGMSARWKALAKFRGWPASKHEQTRRELAAAREEIAELRERQKALPPDVAAAGVIEALDRQTAAEDAIQAAREENRKLRAAAEDMLKPGSIISSLDWIAKRERLAAALRNSEEKP